MLQSQEGASQQEPYGGKLHRVVETDVAIQQNKEKMRVRSTMQSTGQTSSLKAAKWEEAEALLADKRIVETDVAIQQNLEKMVMRLCRTRWCCSGRLASLQERWAILSSMCMCAVSCCRLKELQAPWMLAGLRAGVWPGHARLLALDSAAHPNAICRR